MPTSLPLQTPTQGGESHSTPARNQDVGKEKLIPTILHPASHKKLNPWRHGLCLPLWLALVLLISSKTAWAQAAQLRISAQPVDVAIKDGEEAFFEVGVEADSEVTYQWYWNEQPIPGEVTSFYVIPRTAIHNAGYYSVVVTAGEKTVKSRFAKLTLSNRLAGAITFALNNAIRDVDTVTIAQGTNLVAQLLVGPTSNLLASAGSILPLQSGILRGSIITTPTIPPGSNAFVKIRVWDILAGATYDQARTNGRYGESIVKSYVAHPNTSVGTDPQIPSFSLYELGRPKLATQPSPLAHTLVIGSTASFAAVLTGELPLQYQWFFNDKAIPGANQATFTMTNVQAWDTGDYVLEVANAAGKIRSRPSSLSVFATNTTPGSKNAGFNIGDGPNQSIRSVVELRDGRVLVAGGFIAFNGLKAPGLARLHRDGQVDTSFRPPAVESESITQIWLDSQERIYVQTGGSNTKTVGVKRLLFDGSVDPSYTALKTTSALIYPYPATGAFLLRRNDFPDQLDKYDEDGLLDSHFQLSGLTSGWNAVIYPLRDASIILHSINGQIRMSNSPGQRYLAQLDQNGKIVTNFPNRAFNSMFYSHDKSHCIGITSANEMQRVRPNTETLEPGVFLLGLIGAANQLLEQSNRKCVIYSSASQFVRFLPDGTLDTKIPSFYPLDAQYYGISILLQDGSILYFGTAPGSSALTKYHFDFARRPAFLRALRKTIAGPVTLTMDVQPNMPYLLQKSSNLADWSDVKSAIADNAVTRLSFPSSGKSFEFYRLITE